MLLLLSMSPCSFVKYRLPLYRTNIYVFPMLPHEKVRVYGPGIEHGVLATFQSRFICDTRGAGAGQLTVRVRGPKGAFRVEMQRESQKDRTILCKVIFIYFITNFGFHECIYNLFSLLNINLSSMIQRSRAITESKSNGLAN